MGVNLRQFLVFVLLYLSHELVVDDRLLGRAAYLIRGGARTTFFCLEFSFCRLTRSSRDS